MAKPGEQAAEQKLTKAEPAVAIDAAAPVFISYAREDRKRAEMIVALLKGAGFEVWWDGLMEAGTQFQRELSDAIDRSRAVVVLWSQHAAQSVWVQDEAGCGRDRHCMVPISLDGTPAPLGFRQYQAIDFSRWRGRANAPEAESLIRAVAKAMQMAEPVHCHPPKRAPGLPRRTLLLLAGGGAVAAAAAYGVWRSGITGMGGATTSESIAVLPFANLSGDPAQAYFSDGLAAEIRSELARNPMLQVAAQASSESFRERKDDAKVIAERLGVDYILDGNVRRAGDKVRVAAELIDGRSGFSAWSRSFERPLADVFQVQSEIAAAVGTALGEEIGSASPPAAPQSVGGTTNIAAYDAYLRGRGLFRMAADEASDRAALAAFDEAIAADPGYAAAHAARSRSVAAIANQYATEGAERRRLYAEAVSAAERAVALAPDLADTHSALGFALFYGRLDARAARAPFERSYALGAGNADVLARYALYSARTGRFDAASAAILKAERLDPLNPRTWRSAGSVSFAARRYEEAIRHNRRALMLNPRMGVANAAVGDAELAIGRVDAAEAAYRAERNSLFGLPGLAIVANKRGRTAEAEALMDRLIAEHGENSLYQQAQIHAQAGARDKAIAALRRAKDMNDSGVAIMRDDALLDPVRDDPRFQQLLRDVGLA